MDRNRTAQVFYTIGFMLGGVFGYIAGVVSTEGFDVLCSVYGGCDCQWDNRTRFHSKAKENYNVTQVVCKTRLSVCSCTVA